MAHFLDKNMIPKSQQESFILYKFFFILITIMHFQIWYHLCCEDDVEQKPSI